MTNPLASPNNLNIMGDSGSSETTADNVEPLLDKVGIRRTITRLAHEIVEGNSGIENLVLVGIQRRGPQ